MNIHCMSRTEAQKLFRKIPAAEKIHYACISITGTWDPPLNRSFFPRYTLPLTFDDVDGRLAHDSNLVPMSCDDADSESVRFVSCKIVVRKVFAGPRNV